MHNNIAAGGIKVFISAISVFAFLPLNGNIYQGLFVSVFVYLLSRGGECIFSLMNENYNRSIMGNAILMILYFICGAIAAMFSWNIEVSDFTVAFVILYIVCALSLFSDIVDVISRVESCDLMKREAEKKRD